MFLHSGSYMSENQYSNQYPLMNGTTVPTYSVNNPLTSQSVPTYSTGKPGATSAPKYGGQVVTAEPSSPAGKGPLAFKYPQTTSAAYGTAAGYGVNTYNPLDYNQQPNYYG